MKGTRDQMANIVWIVEKAKEFQKKHLLLFYWLCQSLWLCVSQKNLWKILKEMGIPYHLTCQIYIQVKKQQLKLDMEDKLGKE